ncbi:MAG: RNA polymerase-binding protein DksA [Deltaproteobacteria bacterium CG11_big_fil_rev_8_21_14_0_20_47_16]|nr:MAG: RNA polymerase-binding protein DksA [Deltaproteobacteria bacterium CG11_big_fil_rev_8_21_14_0_20_47_16]
MNKKDLKRFRDMLTERSEQILESLNATKDATRVVDPSDLPDEVDQASSEADQSMQLRLRDRENVLLKKILKTIQKIDDGDFGICEKCGDDIDIKRLEARPVTDLCIRCKEEEERREKTYAG